MAADSDAGTSRKKGAKGKAAAAGKGGAGGKKKKASAFFTFMKLERPKILNSMPNASVTQQAKECGERWRRLSESEKQKYRDLAAKGVK